MSPCKSLPCVQIPQNKHVLAFLLTKIYSNLLCTYAICYLFTFIFTKVLWTKYVELGNNSNLETTIIKDSFFMNKLVNGVAQSSWKLRQYRDIYDNVPI